MRFIISISAFQVKLPAKQLVLSVLLGEKPCRDAVKSVISTPYDFRFSGKKLNHASY